MRIIYLSPGYNNPHLFPTYKKTFEERGHSETISPYDATHCFIELVSGEMKFDMGAMKIIKERGIPMVCFDNREFGGYSKEVWSDKVSELYAIHFVRTLIKDQEYLSNVYPYDWAYFNDCDFQPTTKEELFSRPYDCCYIGVDFSTRTNVINALVNDGTLKVKHTFRNHLQRLPHDQWVNEYRDSKMAIEIEGGGLTSEKFLQLFAVAPQLRVVNEMRMAFPFTDKINCLEISKEPTEYEIKKVFDVLKDKDWLFEIYEKGIRFMKENYSESAVANYVLGILNQNGV